MPKHLISNFFVVNFQYFLPFLPPQQPIFKTMVRSIIVGIPKKQNRINIWEKVGQKLQFWHWKQITIWYDCNYYRYTALNSSSMHTFSYHKYSNELIYTCHPTWAMWRSFQDQVWQCKPGIGTSLKYRWNAAQKNFFLALLLQNDLRFGSEVPNCIFSLVCELEKTSIFLR